MVGVIGGITYLVINDRHFAWILVFSNQAARAVLFDAELFLMNELCLRDVAETVLKKKHNILMLMWYSREVANYQRHCDRQNQSRVSQRALGYDWIVLIIPIAILSLNHAKYSTHATSIIVKNPLVV